MINWKECELSIPPLLLNKSTEELMKFIDEKLLIKNYPNHTQAVERAVKLVTEASMKVCGYSHRDGYIKSGLMSKKNLPDIETKRNYGTYFNQQ